MPTRTTRRYRSRIAAVALLMPLVACAQTLPDDIDPQTLNRLPPASAGSGPGVAGILQHASDIDARFEAAVGRALTELAILVVAREHDQPYEWSLHETEALAVGVSTDVIDIVRHRRSLTGVSDDETLIIELGREVFRDHAVSAETYARAVEAFGQTNLVDVVSLMGNYVSTAIKLTAFNQHMPPGWPQFLPLPFEQPDDVLSDTRSRLPRVPPRPRSGGGAGSDPPLYSRGLAPAGTGPGQIRRHTTGPAELERNVGPALVDLAVLIAAQSYESEYLWSTTAAAAREHGLEAAVIAAVRDNAPTAGLPERAAVLIDFGRELLDAHTVSAETYARALATFGQGNLVNFVDVMASSAEQITLLIVFDQR
jgi:alkylhydroperoxidase family enzyme